MKTLIVGVATLISLSGFAVTAPKHYYCEGDGMSATVSVVGGSYYEMDISTAGGGSSLRPALQVAHVPFGMVLSQVTQYVPDYSEESLSILLPNINFLTSAMIAFETKIYRAVNYTSIAGPSLVDGMISELTGEYKVNCRAYRDHLEYWHK